MILADMNPILNVKAITNSSIGALGVGAAATAQSLTFHESSWFKAGVALLGVFLACITIYNVYLDVKIKRQQLDDKDDE